ncbi:MAG: methyltransferase domain-containing protein [Chloroflexi bacterium]|nr:methyltransferase domain-containing protein [Chloroflexota bacterium]
MPWDPDRYEQFSRERYAPFEDLIKLVQVREGLRVIDLGCGTGELTRRLADALPESDVVGIDSSPEMLSRAEEQARPGLRFESGTIEAVAGEWDLIFSNAAIQWAEDHPALVPRLLGLLRPGGQLVVQIPSNFAHPTNVFIDETAGEEPFREALDGWLHRWPVLTVDAYAELLYAHGGEELTVFEKVYPHVLDDSDALATWMSGTALVPYFERMPEALHEPFMERYRERLRERWPARPVFFGFRRILLAATRT